MKEVYVILHRNGRFKIIITEPAFDFLLDKRGSITLAILKKQDPPDDPFFIFDKCKVLLFFRSKKEIIKLTHIPKIILKQLQYLNNLTVIEMTSNSQIVNCYNSPIVIDKSLYKKYLNGI